MAMGIFIVAVILNLDHQLVAGKLRMVFGSHGSGLEVGLDSLPLDSAPSQSLWMSGRPVGVAEGRPFVRPKAPRREIPASEYDRAASRPTGRSLGQSLG